jgi:hypothetical protein
MLAPRENYVVIKPGSDTPMSLAILMLPGGVLISRSATARRSACSRARPAHCDDCLYRREITGRDIKALASDKRRWILRCLCCRSTLARHTPRLKRMKRPTQQATDVDAA